MNNIRFILFCSLMMLVYINTRAQSCTATFTMSQAANGVINFTSTTNASNTNAAVYSWNYGDGSSPFTAAGATGRYPAHTYSINGNYVVSTTVTTFTPACSNTFSNIITVTTVTNCPVAPSFTFSQFNGQVSFTNLSTGTVMNTTYSWNFGNSQTSTLTNPVASYTSNGNYTVSLIANNNSAPTCSNITTSVITVSTICGYSLGITYTLGANGTVSFSPLTNYTAGLNYVWNLGNNQTSSLTAPVTTYTSNTTYTVLLFATQATAPFCQVNTGAVINVTNAPTCSLAPNFTTTNGPGNQVNFINTSTGTLSGASYTWNFGDNTANSNNAFPAHTFSASGTYSVKLKVSNNTIPTCVDSVTKLVSVVNCSLVAGFTYTVGGSGLVGFSNTSTGTQSTTTYTLAFGHAGATSTLVNVTHVYPNGTFVATLTAFNYSGCVSNTTQTITVTNTCVLNAQFTHTVLSNGQVNFNNVSTGTTALTTHTWNFGDGAVSTVLNPQHVYVNGGTHYVSLSLAETGNSLCVNSNTMAVNITGVACVANAQFSLVPTGTAQVWNAIPVYPWNISQARWDWGDATSSNTLFTSHQYSVSGQYSICLTVTASCGSTATACSSYSMFIGSQGIIYINVVPINWIEITSIEAGASQAGEIDIYPNPGEGKFFIDCKDQNNGSLELWLFNYTGELLHNQKTIPTNDVKKCDVSYLPDGVYLIKLKTESKVVFKRLIIKHF